MHSMTGYGEATSQIKGMQIKATVRSVNHRFLNLQMNLLEALAAREDEIEQLIRKYIKRGSVNLSLKADALPTTPGFNFNLGLLKKYTHKLKSVQRSLQIRDNLDLTTLMNLPGVMEPINSMGQFTRSHLTKITEVIRKALSHLVQMRCREGKRLQVKLQRIIQKMFSLTKNIKRRIPVMRNKHENSLRTRIKEVLRKQGLEPTTELNQRLAEEVALFAQRVDITEELHRLDSHLNEFTRAMDNDADVGKKLEFLTQEMLREINTTGSKANDIQIAHLVVSLKSEVEKLKEQGQNIE